MEAAVPVRVVLLDDRDCRDLSQPATGALVTPGGDAEGSVVRRLGLAIACIGQDDRLVTERCIQFGQRDDQRMAIG